MTVKLTFRGKRGLVSIVYYRIANKWVETTPCQVAVLQIIINSLKHFFISIIKVGSKKLFISFGLYYVAKRCVLHLFKHDRDPLCTRRL